jgi:HD-GYP domain-containing protein (c-di-GMP phosphodiesterase class II)
MATQTLASSAPDTRTPPTWLPRLVRRCEALGAFPLALAHSGETRAPVAGQLGWSGVEPLWAVGAASPLGASMIAQRVLLSTSLREALASQINDQTPDSVAISVGPGCWLAKLPPTRRAPRAHLGVLMLGRAFAGSALFLAACKDIGADPAEACVELRASLRFDAGGAGVATASLVGAVRDFDESEQHREAIAEFTTQLTDSYETINLMYALARELDDPANPSRVMQIVCERLRESSGLAWVGVGTIADRAAPPPLSERTFSCGSDTAGAWFERAVPELVRRVTGLTTSRIFVTSALPGAPFDMVAHPLVLEGRCVGVLCAGNKRADDALLSSYDSQLVEAAGRYLAAFLHNCALYAQQRSLFLGSVKSLTASIDAKDRYTRGHSDRVAHVSRQLATAMGLDANTAERVHLAGLLHDVGKIGVPESVLCKQGKLTDEEFAQIKKHPEQGFAILRDIPLLDDVLPGVLHHHERFDGTGYPHGLAGERIPLVARIIAVADAFDAMSSTRSYRPAMPRATVLEKMRLGIGSQFDPRVGQAFLTLDLNVYDEMVSTEETRSRAA